MKKIILILTLLFASQVMAVKLTEVESGNAKLAALEELVLTADAEYKVELEKEIALTSKAIKKAERINLINAKKKAMLIAKHNAEIDNKIDEVNKLDLNVNDLCVEYIVKYEQEKNDRLVTLKRIKGTNSCFSKFEISSEVVSEIPFVTHEQLIDYFDNIIADKIHGLVIQKR